MKPLQISLKDFLITGVFGSIRLGAPRKQVLDAFGEPDGWGSQQEKSRAEIWRYGGIEFYFPRGGDGLYMIFSDHLHNLIGGERFDLDCWILNPKLTLATCEDAFEREQITYDKTHLLNMKRIELKLASGAVISFHREDTASIPMLGAFAIAARAGTTMATHQVSVTLPLHSYEKLRRISTKQKRSIAALCTQLLIEQLDYLPDEP